MGKHERGYQRVPRDLYPTPAWVIDALAQHVNLDGVRVWEPACGGFQMVNALRNHGAKVWPSDIAFPACYARYSPRWLKAHTLDFASNAPNRRRFGLIVTNPPFGPRGSLAVRFIEYGLKRLDHDAMLCLLLPC